MKSLSALPKFFKYFAYPVPVRLFSASQQKWKETVKLLWNKKLPFETAIKSLKEIIAEDPSDLSNLSQYCAILYERRQWMDLYQAYSTAQEVSKNSLLPQIFESLYQFEIKNNNSSALELLNKIKGQSLTSAENRCLSMLLAKMGKHEEALKYIINYFDYNPKSSDLLALYDRMSLELACKRYKDALKSAKLLLSYNPTNIGVRYTKIMALKGLKRMDEAIVELTLLIGEVSDPAYKATLYRHRAQCRSNKELEEKIFDLEMSSQLCPENGADKDILMLLFESGMYDKVDEMIEKIAKRKVIEHDFDIAMLRGDMYRFIRKDYDNALKWYKHVHELAPGQYKEHFQKQIQIIEDLIKNEKKKQGTDNGKDKKE